MPGRSCGSFLPSVGLGHRAVQIEDQLVQGPALPSAINPLPRHVHQGLQVLSGCQRTLHPHPPAITSPVLFMHVSPARATGAPTSGSRRSNGFAHDKPPRAHSFPPKPKMPKTRHPISDHAYHTGSSNSLPDNNLPSPARHLAFPCSTPSPSPRNPFESQKKPFSPHPDRVRPVARRSLAASSSCPPTPAPPNGPPRLRLGGGGHRSRTAGAGFSRAGNVQAARATTRTRHRWR